MYVRQSSFFHESVTVFVTTVVLKPSLRYWRTVYLPAGWSVPALFLPFQAMAYAPAIFPVHAHARTVRPAAFLITILRASGSTRVPAIFSVSR